MHNIIAITVVLYFECEEDTSVIRLSHLKKTLPN